MIRPRATAPCWSRPWRSGSAARTSRSSRAPTGGRRPGGSDWCSATSRSAASLEAPAGVAVSKGRSGGRDRAPPRPGPLCQLRRPGVGLLPQRPVHRARHQRARRLPFGALPDHAGFRGQGRPGPGHPGRPARADQRGGQGLGGGRPGRRAAPTGSPRRSLVTGAGPIGLLAALLGVQRGSRSTSSTR